MAKEYRQTKFQTPPGAAELLLVRHGESSPVILGQPFPMRDGQGDPGLHPEGQHQAQCVGERLRHEPIKAVYVSTLQRTHQTAAPLCKHLQLEMQVDADLREVYLGDWEGGLMRLKEQSNDPIMDKVRTQQRWDAIPGAESNESLQERLTRALERIRINHPNQLVVAVVHGGVIGQILAYAVGAHAFAFVGAANGSIHKIVLTEERIIVRSFNDTAHLTPAHG